MSDKHKFNIKKLYRSKAEQLILFGFVQGVITVMPGVSVKRAIEICMTRMGWCEDDYSLDSAQVEYQRLVKSYYDSCKSD